MRLRTLLSVLVVLALSVGVGGYVMARYLGERLSRSMAREACTVTADGVVTLDSDQLANAATIAAVGSRRQLPERAVVIALATAYQESRIRNLDGGDRDSVGLFQQRPSQGWGSVNQIADPRYAAGKFYDKLIKVPGWESMRVTDAAQAVQISAYPELYEQWAGRATVLTRALLGTTAQAVTCDIRHDSDAVGGASVQDLLDELALDWGMYGSSEENSLSLWPDDAQSGWQYAHWLVTRARTHGVHTVRYAGMEWTAKEGTWARSETRGRVASTRTVTAEIGL